MAPPEQNTALPHTNGTTLLTDPSPPAPPDAQTSSPWSSPGPAAFDFRSDVVTTPTPSMLHAITHTTLLDDVFAEDTTTNDLQRYIAELTGHEDALLVTSGTMGNQLCIRTHLKQPPYSIVADASSHVMQWEAGALAHLTGALSYPIHPHNKTHLTLPDIQRHAVTSTDIHACPTRLIILENTLGGSILPLQTCQSITAWAHAQDPPIAVHCDGARLWEAVAAGAGGLKEFCGCFDSVSLCFSKGLGAPLGSMIVGERGFVQKARHFRKAMGGGLRQAGVISAPARVAIDETFLGGKLAETHRRAKRIAEMWVQRGGRLGRAVETNMVWFDLEDAGCSVERFVEVGVRCGVKVLGGRVVVHYQIGEEGVGRLGRVMDVVLGGEGKGVGEGVDGNALEREVEEVRAPAKQYGDAGGEGVGAL